MREMSSFESANAQWLIDVHRDPSLGSVARLPGEDDVQRREAYGLGSHASFK